MSEQDYGAHRKVKVKFRGNSAELRRRLLKEFQIPYSSYSKEDQEKIIKMLKKASAKGYEAQHIIPIQMKNHPVLVKIGMDMNCAKNGIFLPVPNKTPHTLSTHKGYHKVYNDIVEEYLDKIDGESGQHASVEKLSEEVAKLQQALRTALRAGLPMYFKKKNAKNLKAEDRGGGATKKLWRDFLDRELLKREKNAMKKQYDEKYQKYYEIAKNQIESTYNSAYAGTAEELAVRMMRNYGILPNRSKEMVLTSVFQSLKLDNDDLVQAWCHLSATNDFKKNVLTREMYVSHGRKHVPPELAAYMQIRNDFCREQISVCNQTAENIRKEYRSSQLKTDESKSVERERHNVQVVAKELYEIQTQVWSESESQALSQEQNREQCR